ncbi:MAG: C39 family peptidase [Leptolyngbyaceae cyanobacterium RU_5_1]|nr:C39 family peptidase [Leptolyngbyaceae cyanobacterium RU_5_1]
MSTVLKIINPTILKRRPIQATELPETEKQMLEVGKVLEITSYSSPERNHIRVAFAKESFKGFNTWYAFGEHVQILRDGKVVYPKLSPKTLKLNVPYKSQRDNMENPSGSCNVTSLAMCLEFLGAKRRETSGQFEDELYRYAESRRLSRHNPHDLATIVEAYGCRDEFRSDAKIEQVKDWLADGKPNVIHGYFTSFGHIVVAVGFDETGFLVHDPWGEWNSWGYNLNVPGVSNLKGRYVNYSYSMIRRLCIPDGSFWVHFISKK